MNKFYEKARAVVRLLENYGLRVARAVKVLEATLTIVPSKSLKNILIKISY